MIEAAMIWNEPNNKSHWDPALDPDWSRYAECVTLAGSAIAASWPPPRRSLVRLEWNATSFCRWIYARSADRP